MRELRVQTLALVGSYVPRQCGIATFTKDLRDALVKTGGLEVPVLALDDNESGYPYPSEVRFEIRANILNDYQLATDFLNINQIDVVCVQHEYGLYGARAGENVLKLVRNTRMPVITTLHTLLIQPNKEQAAVMNELVEESDRLVVMNERGRDILMQTYHAPRAKIAVIPHGVPDFAFTDPSFFKDRFGLEGKKMLLTFGLLSPGKGIETAIRALPQILQAQKNAVYVILGAIHPHVLKREGNNYLIQLEQLAEKLGVREHILFHNRYVSREELCGYLSAADIYISPYPKKEQISSGTLSYAMAAGKAVVSTPYWHAEEMLANNRGRLFPFNDPEALAAAVIGLLQDSTGLDAMRKKAYLHSRQATWEEVGKAYGQVALEVLSEREQTPRVSQVYHSDPERIVVVPDVKLDHLRALTDDTGILQHAVYTVPNRHHGYCTDDNARALVVSMLYWELTEDDSILPLANKYLSFLHSAYDAERRQFLNMFSYDRHWEKEGARSDDVLGRSLWGLGATVAIAPNDGTIALASRLFCAALATAESVPSPRAWALSLVGIHFYLRRFSGDSYVRRVRETLAARLYAQFKRCATDDWVWCEDTVTYDNGKLPHALLLCGQWLPAPEMVAQGLRSLEWLLKKQRDERGHLNLIGNQSWMNRNGSKAQFDQQPIDAMALVEACAEAYRCTKDPAWMRKVKWCLEWFLGNNVTESVVYDASTGGCRDGLHANGPNLNEGAESTLAWLISLLTMNRLLQEKETGIFEQPATPELRTGNPG